MKLIRIVKGHPLPATRVDLLDEKRRRKEGSGEEQNIEENPQGIHRVNLRLNPLDVKHREGDNLV